MSRMIAIGALALLLGASAADAAPGWTRGDVNMRAGPGVGYARILTIPAGARVQATNCTSWCTVRYAGQRGWVSASYIAFGGALRRQVVPPAVIIVPAPMPPSIHWYYGRPYWDHRHRAWHAGRRWWYDGRWHQNPRRR